MLYVQKRIMARKQTGINGKEPIVQDSAAKRNDGADANNEFPGYPHYDKKEDIMDGRSDSERVNVDVESLPTFHNATTPHRLNGGKDQSRSGTVDETENDMDIDLGIEMGTEADVTAEEKAMLEDDMYYPTQDEDRLRQARLDDTDFDGEKLNENSFGSGQAESGDDLDMDVTAEETLNDSIGQEDEENQYFSLGDDEIDNAAEGTP